MQDTHKYLVHARITADGVVERSDVVGAVFGQTEGLLGDELDLRDLQDSSRIGRIDVEIDSEHGQSFGHITIASSLDKAETALLAAALETITRVGPCEARVEIAEIEDMRAAKRREIVDRAKELMRESFDESVMESGEILDEVREARRVEGIVEYDGLPAGPRVADSDAVILVEGRSDVVTLLEYGIKNAIAVEGTNVPDEIASLTRRRTVTAFLDGDRGGDLILRELAQIGEIDYVASAPDGRSVEDLSRDDVMDALREKVPFDGVTPEADEPDAEIEATRAAGVDAGPASASGGAESDGGVAVERGTDGPDRVGAVGGVSDHDDDESAGRDRADENEESGERAESDETDDPGGRGPSVGGTEDGRSVGGDRSGGDAAPDEGDAVETTAGTATDAAGTGAADVATGESDATADAGAQAATAENAADADGETATGDGAASDVAGDTTSETGPASEAESDEGTESDDDPFTTLQRHVRSVIEAESKRARVLDRDLQVLRDVPAAEAFDAVSDAETAPFAVVLDGRLEQRLLDVAAQRGVEQIVARSEGEYVKRPTSVRVVTADRLVSA